MSNIRLYQTTDWPQLWSILQSTFARQLGFSAMQFNRVVATNHGAIGLWKKLGFEVVATLPGAFDH